MNHERGVRVYGVMLGNSSAARITKGAIGGLKELGKLVGVVPVDAFDELSFYEGPLAQYGVLFGPPNNMTMMMRGAHQRNFVMLAPNSNWVPQNIVRSAKQLDEALAYRDSQLDLIAPSAWGATQLQRYWHRKVLVWRHGVSKEFQPLESMHHALNEAYKSRHFRVLHLTSSAGQRKGTRELIEAWEPFVRECGSELEFCRLTIVAEPGRHLSDLREMCSGDDSIDVKTRLDWSEAAMSKLYCSYHVVCQPSRGEGFGLVPLEARACGIPVVMTDCTGHGEHSDDAVGSVIVHTGIDKPIDDGPGARAPELEAKHVQAALFRVAMQWPKLHKEALDASQFVSHDWSWKNTTEDWLEQVQVENELE